MRNERRIPTWCPGCGTYLVNAALKQALKELKVKDKDVVMSFDIGCSGNMVNVNDFCSIATLHGRSIPVACGVRAVRDDLKVIAQAGDGGLLNEGLNHFIHAVQRDDDITLLLNNNHVFGLTAGQQSSATPKGETARSAQVESQFEPLSAVDLAATTGAKFIARVHEENAPLIKEVLKQAIAFPGFALVEIIQPCKIWAKGFEKIEYTHLDKRVKESKELIGQHNLTGILFVSKAERKNNG
jgi:2-oxoglutarate ferredoxin oxidoreductase subunit beta